MRFWMWPVLVGIWIGGCSCGSDPNTNGTASTGPGGMGGGMQGACLDGLTAITIDPANSTVMLDGGMAPPVTFTATGTFGGGPPQPIDASKLVWDATRDDATPPGLISAGVLATYPYAGGTVHISATDGCVTGKTDVNFRLDAAIGMPSNPGDWTGGPVTGAPAPDIVYPSDQTRFPRNLYRTLFQWHSQGFTEFRLIFKGLNSTVTVYTDGAHGLCANANPAAGCWEVDEKTWSFIAASNAGSTATWTVDALDKSTTPPTVRRSDAIEIGFSKMDVEGAIFYWSTTSAGVRRGRISQQHPEDYIVGKPSTTYPDAGVDAGDDAGADAGADAVKCVACHVVSRDGNYMAAPVDATSGQSLWILDVTKVAPPNPLVKDIENTGGHGFATFSPHASKVVAAFQGKMWMVDTATGDFVNDLPTGTMQGTHPDWSPKGDEVVFATGDGDAPAGSSLALIPFMDGTWGQPTVLLAPPMGQTNIFPQFSPDAEWIAYARGKGGHGDVLAQLMLISEKGGMPIELINANRITSNQTTDGLYQNSQPTWAPPGDYNWVAFNTKREYGVVLPKGTQQIWVAAIDLEKAKTGQDPSYPAFRVPFQGLAENNHRAYWTLDIGQGTGGGGGSGAGGAGGAGGMPCTDILTLGEMCDPLNDCCETGSYCDTTDSGMTYTCNVPN